MSDSFRKVYADVPGAVGDRARVYIFGQYEGAIMQNMLQFLDDYFNNGDGQQHVQDPHPPSYFIWGGGGAIYYGTKNRFGLMEKEPVANDNFDQPALHDGQAVLHPANAGGWTFAGNAGICSTHIPGQWLVNGQQLPKDPAPAQETAKWAGLKFTVGDKDLYVYQVGRWAQDGNKGSHEIAIFDTNKKVLNRWLAEVDSKTAKSGDYASGWCYTRSSGRLRQLPVRLLAGQTYYLVCQEQAGANADRFFGGDTGITQGGTGLTIEAAVIGDGAIWQETPGKRSFGPLTMRYTSERLTTYEGEIGVPPDWTVKFHSWEGPEPFDLGTQCAFLCGKSSIRQTVKVEKAGTYWVTLNLAVDQVSPGGSPTLCRILVDGSDRTSRPLPIGGWDFKVVSFNYAASHCFHLEPGTHEITIEGISAKGTLYVDSVHLCSEEAFYGGPGAPNFPSGGNAFGQVAATGYYKTAHAECDMAYNWGLVPCTYEGGWAVQSDFDHYSMLAWNDLRYGGHDTHPEWTQQALAKCLRHLVQERRVHLRQLISIPAEYISNGRPAVSAASGDE